MGMFKTHSFEFDYESNIIFVEFWGPKEWQNKSHLVENSINLTWAKSIIDSHCFIWHSLCPHTSEFIRILHSRNLNYEEYLVYQTKSSKTILCRSIEHMY